MKKQIKRTEFNGDKIVKYKNNDAKIKRNIRLSKISIINVIKEK